MCLHGIEKNRQKSTSRSWSPCYSHIAVKIDLLYGAPVFWKSSVGTFEKSRLEMKFQAEPLFFHKIN
jgi:hypothetical protein